MDVQAGSLEEYRSELGEVSAKVLDAQPAMAPLVTLVLDVLASVEASADLETAPTHRRPNRRSVRERSRVAG